MKRRQVDFTLRPTSSVPEREIKQILRAADDLIASGGRSLLAKVLEGIERKKAVRTRLDRKPILWMLPDLVVG